jgi:quinoprotein glucose dehydrogenase
MRVAVLALLIMTAAAADGQAPVESAAEREALPLYKTIPAARRSELTRSRGSPAWRSTSWSRSHGDQANTRYSALDQINRDNVHRLEVAWIYHSRDGKGNIQANPVIVQGVLYAPTVGQNIVAIDASSGQEIWRFHPGPELVGSGYGPAERGLTYWAGDTAHSARLFFMANGYLIALEAKTGQLVDSFGDQGKKASTKGAGTSAFLGAVAPIIYRNVIVAPNQNKVDAYDVINGGHLWSFDTVMFPAADPKADNGANVWGGIAMDESRGIAFIVAGDPHPNFIGIGRLGKDAHANSVIALEAISGRLLWSFQEVAHNLWDLDTPAPPNLVSVMHEGKRVDAVAIVTKFGNTLLLDRVSGKPLFPYRLRRAPTSTLPGEQTAAYQPDLQIPQPFARQVFRAEDVTDLSPEAHAFVMQRVSKATYGWFLPPRLDQDLIFYGVHGGAEWTGASFDPTTGFLYVSSNELAFVESLGRVIASHNAQRLGTVGRTVFLSHCALCHGEEAEGKGMAPSLRGLSRRLSQEDVTTILKHGRDAMPAIALSAPDRQELLDLLFERNVADGSDAPRADAYEASGFERLLDDQGYPGTKPPWGTLNAINLETGKLAWKVPLGEYDDLTRRGVPKTGTENFGGPTATGGGLVFCAGTRDLKIRAFDQSNGAELWAFTLPFGGYAAPATYEVHGRQYVVIAATGGGKLGGEMGDAYVAFALPK